MKRIIVDCDNTLGVRFCDSDDGLAILYLLGCPDAEVLGITTTYGNSKEPVVYGATTRMLEELGRTDIPVYRGGKSKDERGSDAASFLAKTVHDNPGEISVLATGSLTNLLGAAERNPAFFREVKEIVLMGGISAPLAFPKNTMDELNFSCDPAASYRVLTEGTDVSIATGNQCLGALFTTDDYERALRGAPGAGNYVYERTLYYNGFTKALFGVPGFYVWDVIAAAELMHPEFFDAHPVRLALSEDDLRCGFLQPADGTEPDRPVTTVDIPVIRDGDALKEHIFKTWRRAQVTVSGKPAGRLHLLWERFSSQTLNQMVFLLWKTGMLKISYGEEGVEHQFGRKSE